MRKHLPTLATLVCGLLVWAAVTWPMPKIFRHAIPLTERRAPAAPRLVVNQPGDQMQLLYHFWLARDTFAGKTPPFANVYEFNFRGDDALRRFSTYYIPFSLVHAAVSPFFGDAAGWNAAGLFSFLLGLFGMFVLARRLSRSGAAAAFVAAMLSAFPYRWHALLTGSPTGFAICFVPWLAYGIDRLVRDASARGAAVAGLAVFLAFCSDLHVFYFSALATPFFAAISLVLAGWRGIEFRKVCIAAIPLAFFAAAAAILAKLASADLGSTTMQDGRTLREIALFSPVMRGLFVERHLEGATNTIYIGIFACAFFPLAFVRLLADGGARRGWRGIAAAALLGAAACAAVTLAAGVYGPFNGLPIRIARAIVPKYGFIRQPAKIFCLMPTILAAFSAICLAPFAARSRAALLRAAILGVCALAQQVIWFRPTLNILSADAPAYAATAAAAAESGEAAPKALAVPLWPGDSHWSSLYEQGVMHSRLRLLNGYSPSPPADYFDEVFRPLESVNQGGIDFAQYRRLRDFGVGWLLFHENAFPDKVSPFPAGVSLDTLARNPALQPVFADDGVSAFRILDGIPEEAFGEGYGEDALTALDFPPALVWNAHRVARSLETASAPGRINLALRAPLVLHPGMRYMLHCSDGSWRSIPLDNPMGGEYALPEGLGKPDLTLVTAGREVPTSGGAIKPSRMFHSGTSNPADGSVAFGKRAIDYGVPNCVMEGPFVPIPAGRWKLSVDADGAIAAGARIELLRGIRGEAEALDSASFMPADGGVPRYGSMEASRAEIEFDRCDGEMPFGFRIVSCGLAPMNVTAITLIPL